MSDEHTIKVRIDDSGDGGDEGGRKRVPKQEQKAQKTPKKPTVLLVDDDELILHMYRTKLDADGYEVFTATKGSDALAVAKEHRPDIIFLDVVMADMNGAEILKSLKDEKTTKNISVVMLTNFSSEKDDIEGAKKMGAHDYLIKAQTDPPALSKYIAQYILSHKSYKKPRL